MEDFIYTNHDWDNENVNFKNTAVSVFGTEWKRKVAKAASFIGLESTTQYTTYMNSLGDVTPTNPVFVYVSNIRLKLTQATNVCE